MDIKALEAMLRSLVIFAIGKSENITINSPYCEIYNAKNAIEKKLQEVIAQIMQSMDERRSSA